MIKTCISKMDEIMKKDAFWKWACIVAFVFANIMYLCLAFGKTFHYDEAYSVGMAANSFSEIIDITSKDVHSPFYYFTLKLFCMIPGMSDLVGAKLLSWVFLLLYMIFGAVVIRRKYDWKIAFYWTLLSGFVPSLIIQATTVRMYTMGLFFVTVASYLAYSLFEQETKKKWIVFTVFSIFAVYIHTFCMLEMVAVYVVFLVACIRKKNYKKAGMGVISGIVVSICFQPWLYVLWQQFARWTGMENGWSTTFLPVNMESVPVYLSEWFSSMERPQELAVLFWVILFIFASFHVRDYVKKTKDYLPVWDLVLIGIILVVAALISYFAKPCFLGRYVLPLFAGVWLFIAVGIAKSGNILRQILIIVLVVFFGAMAFKSELEVEDSAGLDSYMQYVEEEMDITKDVIMADRYFTMMLSIYCPEANYMVYGYSPEGLPFQNTEVFTDWSQLDGVDTVWFLSFADNPGASLNEKYDVEDCIFFDYSYYHIKLEKYVRK